jgi:hypothetical protein
MAEKCILATKIDLFEHFLENQSQFHFAEFSRHKTKKISLKF